MAMIAAEIPPEMGTVTSQAKIIFLNIDQSTLALDLCDG